MKKKQTQEFIGQEVKAQENPDVQNQEEVSAEKSVSDEIGAIWTKLDEVVGVIGNLITDMRQLKGNQPQQAEKSMDGIKTAKDTTKVFDREIENIKSIFKDFDIKAVLKSNDKFKEDMKKSGSVYFAFLKHLADTLQKDGYQSRGFIENGAMPLFASGDVNSSPASYSDNAFEEYINGILGV